MSLKSLDEEVQRHLQIAVADDKIGEEIYQAINTLIANSNNGLFQFTQSFNSSAPPSPSSQFRVDTNNPATVTKFYIGYNAALSGSYNIQRIFESFLTVGSKFYMQRQQANGSQFCVGVVDAFVDQGNYAEIDATIINSGGANFGTNGSEYTWAFLFKV